jgi:mycothiol synthase
MDLRAYRPADAGGAGAVRDAARRVEDTVQLPGDSPLSLIAALDDGTVTGYSWVDWWDEADGTRLYLLAGCVHPAHRGAGIGRALLRRQEAQAAEHWRTHPGAGPVLLGGNAEESQPATRALLLAAGYRVRFTVVDLARDPAGADDVALPDGLELRPVNAGHHPLIYAAVETCFAASGHGHHPRGYADYLRDVRDVDLWLVAWDGPDVAAVLVNERRPDGSVDTPWVAVLPAWRRRGVAQALLQRSLRLLAGAGVATAVIRTVHENPNHTVDLYERAGYRIVARHPRYAKPLTQDPPK